MSVQDFLTMANWQGAPVATLVTNLPQVSLTALAEEINLSEIKSGERNNSPVPAESWRCLTVEQFFGRQNWQGLAQPAQPSPSSLENATVLPPVPTVNPTFAQTVQEFFQRFPWDGLPAIGVLPNAAPLNAALLPQPSEPEMTLSDLSDLF